MIPVLLAKYCSALKMIIRRFTLMEIINEMKRKQRRKA
jgi:hypothetical protein